MLDEILASGMPPPPIRTYAGGGFVGERRMAEYVEPTPDAPHPNGWMVPQWRTEQILHERLAEAGVQVERGVELVDFRQDEDGVTARLSTGPIRAEYLVGTDGGRSTVRNALGVDFPGETDEATMMVFFDARITGLDDRSHSYRFTSPTDPGCGIGLTPLAGTDVLQGAAMPPRTHDISADAAYLQHLFDDRSAGRVRIEELTWSTVWRPNSRLARRFRSGRVSLAGDSAHVHPPTGGQGLNTSVQDSCNLGWKLADGSPDLLDSYEAERRPVAASVLGLSGHLLDKALAGHEDAFRRGRETNQLDIDYRSGPLTEDERVHPGRVRAGDRAPDSPLRTSDGNPTRILELLRGPRWTLLAFDAETPETGPGVNTHRITTGCAEGSLTDDGAYDVYDVVAGTVVLIRPDGYIARITTG